MQLQCFKGAWKSQFPSSIDSNVPTIFTSLDKAKQVEQYSPEERQKLSLLVKRNKDAQMLEPINPGKREQLTRQLLLR